MRTLYGGVAHNSQEPKQDSVHDERYKWYHSIVCNRFHRSREQVI